MLVTSIHSHHRSPPVTSSRHALRSSIGFLACFFYTQMGLSRNGIPPNSTASSQFPLRQLTIFEVHLRKRTRINCWFYIVHQNPTEISHKSITYAITWWVSPLLPLRSWIPPQDNSAKAIVGYRIYRDDGNGGAIDSQLALTDENTFSYTDSGLVTGNVYYYRWGDGMNTDGDPGKIQGKKGKNSVINIYRFDGDFPIFHHFTSRFSMIFHLSYLLETHHHFPG